MRIANFNFPIVSRKNEQLKLWPCSDWSIQKWTEIMKGLILTFRVHSKNNPEKEQWETDYKCKIKCELNQFIDWLKNSNKECNDSNDCELLSRFSPLNTSLYSSYNYLVDLLNTDHELISSIDWKSLNLFNGEEEAALNPVNSTLWIGNHGSFTPCHYDTYGYNVVVQLKGRKQWVLFQQEDSAYLYPTRLPYEESSVFSKVNLRNPDLSMFTSFKNATPYSVELQEGDLLYVPKHWWHFVLTQPNKNSYDCSISLNLWCSLNDTRDQLKESLVQFMITGILPTYEQWQENESDKPILNEGVNLATSSQTVAITKHLANSVRKKDMEIIQEKQQDKEEFLPKNFERIISCDWSIIEKSLSWSESETRNEGKSIGYRDVIDCIFQPDVIELIAKKLEKLNKI